MIFLDFGTELVNLSQVYQVDVRDMPDGKAVVLVFFYHIAGSTSGGYKVSQSFGDKEEAMTALVSLGVNIRPVKLDQDEEYWRKK
jgi:hypothetical protein